jgi:pyruvate dehydrogenase E2 component (dihydrolipoamide acetyltransferase)
MTEGTLVEWLVEEGTELRRGDVVAEVETGKGVIAIEVYEDGILEDFRVHPGETVAVGTVLAEIRTGQPNAMTGGSSRPDREPPEKSPDSHETVQKPPDAEKTTVQQSSRLHISPLARSRAEQWGIDPASVQGTGPDGAITLADIEGARTRQEPPLKQAKQPVSESAKGDVGARQAMRLAIARATSLSNREIPHYFVRTSIDMHATLTWLEKYNQDHTIAERLLPVVPLLKGVALALRAVPDLNGFYRDDRAETSTNIHLGLAISLRGGGLIAPCIHDVDKKSLHGLMQNLHDLITRTRAGRLRESELRDATLTVTSLGDLGVETVYGVIYPPQLALVGFGRISDRPWAEKGMLTVRPVVEATLSGDHRATDGRTGARFLETLNRMLQEPENL